MKSKTTSRVRLAHGQAGMTLVEVMIAMLLGLFLVGGIMQVFASSRLTYRVHESTARMQETGRMALEVLSRDIRMADFWGCASDLTNVVNNLDNTGTGFIDFGTGGVVGTEGGSGVPDTLTLRGGSDSGLGVQPPYGPQASGNIKVQAGNGLEQGDIIFVSDCSSADIFQISNANPDGGGQLVHNTGSATEPGNYNVTNPGCPGSNAHCPVKDLRCGRDRVLLHVKSTTRLAPDRRESPRCFATGRNTSTASRTCRCSTARIPTRPAPLGQESPITTCRLTRLRIWNA